MIASSSVELCCRRVQLCWAASCVFWSMNFDSIGSSMGVLMIIRMMANGSGGHLSVVMMWYVISCFCERYGANSQ